MRLFIRYRLTALLSAAVIAVFAGTSAAGVKNVAVVESEIDVSSKTSGDELTPTDVRQVTEELRRGAVNNLPLDKYNVMTSETVLAQGSAVLAECAEENCVITLGSKIGADYIVRGVIRVTKSAKSKFTLSVNIFETENGYLVASSEAVRSGDIEELTENAAAACAAMYKRFVETQNLMQKPKPEPEPIAQKPMLEPEPVAQRPKFEPEPAERKFELKPPARKPAPELKEKPQIKRYGVSVNADPTVGGHVLRSPSQTGYALGAMVTITAIPDSGYAFTGWTGTVMGATNPLTIVVYDSVTVTANFSPAYTVAVNANPPGGGSVSLSPHQLNYASGTRVTVTAAPAAGYIFKGWSGAAMGTANPLRITADGNKTLTANFQPCFASVCITEFTFTDNRDGKSYKGVKIGEQAWMAENLNYETPNGSWCYGGDNSNCVKYGRLYDWNTAKTACPSGWRLPSNQEWNVLVAAAGGYSAGKNLKSTARWKYGGGADKYGFSALPGGVRYTGGGFGDADSSGYWWTSTEVGGGSAYRRRIDYNNDGVGELAPYSDFKKELKIDFGKRFGFSVRCVQGEEYAQDNGAKF